MLDPEYTKGRKVYGQVICSFRYGREEDEVMGLNFHKELFLASEQLYPPPEKRTYNLTKLQVFYNENIVDEQKTNPVRIILYKLQERLMKKLGENAIPFMFQLPAGAPGSVTLQQGLEDEGEPCGVQYYVKVFVGESEIDRSHRRFVISIFFS